jgi:outer membrane protein insertion porin family
MIKKYHKLSALLFAVFCCAFFNNSFALELEIKGNQRVTAEVIKANIDLEGLEKKSEIALQNSLKKLYELDLFLDVKINYQGEKIIVELVESPIISEIKFIGNKKVDDDSLQSEISLKKRSVFSKAKLESDLKRINEIYTKTGRFLAKIDPKIIQKEQNRLELIFDINEGPKAKVGKIYFVGNENFSDNDLMEEISTRETKWWKFLSSSDVYDADRIEFDREKLRRYYTARGFADFNSISGVAQINAQKDSFFVTFLFEEGLKYNFGKATIVNNIAKFDASILEKEISFKEGKLYNADLIDKTIDKMVKIMSDNSYAFAQIEPNLKRNKEDKIIDIEFIIQETPKIYINKITIEGNTRTLDEVIRRELRLIEGDPYNVTKISRSKQRIENLGFFEKVDFKTNRVGDSDKVDLIVEVKERKTGEINLGIGYSTVNRLTTSAGIRERNLFGTGQDLGVNVQKSFAALSADINYTKPWFTGRAIDAGFDLFNYELQSRNTLAYDQLSQGVTFRGSYFMTEYLSHLMRYSYSTQDVSNVADTASFSVRSLQGKFVTSALGQSFTYDKRDNRLNPRSGYYLTLSQEYAGVSGDIKTLKHEGSAGLYIPTFNTDFVLKFLARGGVIDGLGQDVRSNNAFFLGGNSFRGFDFAGLGPRTKNANGSAINGEIVGGKIFYVLTAEFMFPLGLPKELGINGILFSENGTVKGVDAISKQQTAIADTGSLRSAYGFSIAWNSPMGPIRFDFSKTLKQEVFDQEQNFRFSFGSSF